MRATWVSRRGFFAVGAAVAVGACGAPAENAEPLSSSVAPPVGAPVSTVATPKLVATPQPSPADIAARYAGQKPQVWGTDLPGITSSFAANGKQLVLTLDACGGVGNNDIDLTLIDFLNDNGIPAVLFLNKRWVDANPGRVVQLASNPLFELANHGVAHRPLSVNGKAAYGIAGTTSAQEAADEVWVNHERIAELTGRAPRFFRPGTAHYDDVAVRLCTELGETPLGFTVNADFGATASPAQVQQAMKSAAPGGVILAHMHRPKSGTAAGMSVALPALRAAGYTFVKP
ncbi:polysaccharide deacetylase family protein [Nocardia camponoti]|uniref:Polysaccharide deacetylase n=1 Tax=Nocardia camponoti TaxID=1616106 RepID=A0A917QMH5_9NOCA|nr:polysaccharide deacetylase family protein [Nocardia camponoti]GGK58489.1 polysaccharide deacetylase [Nocardia camponoti]